MGRTHRFSHEQTRKNQDKSETVEYMGNSGSEAGCLEMVSPNLFHEPTS
jgi:hypothetical protein